MNIHRHEKSHEHVVLSISVLHFRPSFAALLALHVCSLAASKAVSVARELMRCHCRILSALASGALIDAVVSLLFEAAAWVFVALWQSVLQATKQQQLRSSCIDCSIWGLLVWCCNWAPSAARTRKGQVAVISKTVAAARPAAHR